MKHLRVFSAHAVSGDGYRDSYHITVSLQDRAVNPNQSQQEHSSRVSLFFAVHRAEAYSVPAPTSAYATFSVHSGGTGHFRAMRWLQEDVGSNCSRMVGTAEPALRNASLKNSKKRRQPHVSPTFRWWCQALGMSERAVDGWETLHVQAEAAIVWFFGSAAMTVCLLAYMLYGTRHASMYKIALTVLISVCLLTTFVTKSVVWHLGHRFKQTVAYKPTLAATMLPFACVAVIGNLAPIDEIPFGAPLHFDAVLAVTKFGFAAMSLVMPVAVPRQPNKTLLPLAGKALVITVRMMDACTDLSFVRVLEDLVRLYALMCSAAV